MIECTAEYIWKKKRRIKIKFKFLFCMLFCIAIVFLYSNYFIFNQVSSICESSCYSYCNNCVNDAVLSSMSGGVKYGDIVKIEKDNDTISLIELNTITANKISREIVTKTQQNMLDIIKKGVPIPLLAFTGIGLLSGYGKNVYFDSLNVSSVSCDFASEFLSSGINQTLHSLFIVIKCKIDIIFPLKIKTVSVESRVLLTESILVGKIPNVYLGKSNL